MKFVILLLSMLASALAFQAPQLPAPSTRLFLAAGSPPSNKNNNNKKASPLSDFLRQVTNNFKPFHGHGSLENDLDEQWEAQQALLQSRRSHHSDKGHLKKKYSDPSKVKFDGRVGDSSVSQFGKNLEP
jgi:hypothetical protein